MRDIFGIRTPPMEDLRAMWTKRLKENAFFFKKFLQSPATVGSVVPSSRFLVRQMLAPVDWKRAVFVAELGAGTGILTRDIVRRRGPKSRVLVFELDDAMRGRLQEEFRDFGIYSDAARLREIMEKEGIPAFDCILSSLPFAVFPRELRHILLENIRACLAPSGLFVAYQYSLQMRSQFAQVFDDISLRFVPFNVPPAVVYRCRWKAPS